MSKLIVSGLLIGSAFFCSAATLYTNKWTNTQGLAVTNLYGNADNWSVAYEPGVTPPASAVPCKDSKTLILKSASITLQDGDDYTLGTTYFLGASTRFLNLNFIVPKGARLSLDGTDLVSYMNTEGWVDGGTGNRALIDIDGGSLTLGQKRFSMRGNTKEAWTDVPVNRIAVRNGGTLAITNGFLQLFGGSSASSDGKGLYTNIIEVTKGATIALSNSGRIAQGSSHSGTNYDYPWTECYYGGGWINVKGGKIVCSNLTHNWPIVFNGHQDADMGGYLNVTDGGEVDLGGKGICIGSHQRKVPNEINVSGGSVISNMGPLSVQHGVSKANFIIDVNDGKIFFDQFEFGTRSGNADGRPTVRVHGSDSTFDFNGWTLYNYTTPPLYFDMRLAPHTPRNADFAVRPIRTRKPRYQSGGGGTEYVHGYWRLSPDGGLQLVHKKTFELMARSHDSQGEYRFDWRYGGFVGEEMWMTNRITLYEDRWTRYVGYKYAYVYRVSLKDEAKLVDGVQLAQPVPRAWLQLPKFTDRQVNPERMERVSVRLDLVAPADSTLDLDKIVATMREEGGQDAYADSSVSGYNVRVDLPIAELKANTTDDKIVMDFVKCSTYSEASGLVPLTTNALIRAATCESVKKPRGMTLIVR